MFQGVFALKFYMYSSVHEAPLNVNSCLLTQFAYLAPYSLPMHDFGLRTQLLNKTSTVLKISYLQLGHEVALLIEALCYKPEGCRSLPDEIIEFFS
jgi:hypothetical protein